LSPELFQRDEEHHLKHPRLVDLISTNKLPSFIDRYHIRHVSLSGQSKPAPTSAPVGHSVLEWAAIFHPAPDLALTNIVPQSTLCGRSGL